LANPALGTKRICSGCAAKFYDLGKDPIVCPTCETIYVIAKAPPPRGGRAYAPRSTYDPKAQAPSHMGTLAESDAPSVADDVMNEDDREEAEAEAAEGTEEPGGVPMLEELDEK
jgi:uncharacterized protein (TIGR02300 family)